MIVKNNWFIFAAEDYKALTALWKDKQGLYKTICFHSQQYVEKILKGILENNNNNPPRIHDISKLYKECSKYILNIPLLKEEQIFLSSVYIDSRYPPDAGLLPKGEPTREDAELAVAIADKLKK